MERKLKRGATRGDGKVFWSYAKSAPDGEWWITPELFTEKTEKTREANRKRNLDPKFKEHANELRRIRSKKPEVIKRKRELERAARARRRKDPKYIERVNKWTRKWHHSKKDDEKYKTIRTLRSRLYWAVRKADSSKKTSAIHSLGCSIDFLREYLQTRFSKEMTWDNHGIVWEIDHIKPLASFDLTKKTQQEKACHYTNLQPMLIVENRSKGAKQLKQQKLL